MGVLPLPSKRESLSQRQRPGLPLHARWSPPIPERKLCHITAHRARGSEPQRNAGVPALARRLIVVPRAAVVYEWGEPEREQPSDIVGHEDAVLQHEPGRARPRKIVNAEQSRTALKDPRIELGAGLGIGHDSCFGMRNEGMAWDVLTHD